MIDFEFDLITRQNELDDFVSSLNRAAALAVDIETVNWWDQAAERIALIQFAYRLVDQRKSPTYVAIIDALAPDLDLDPLKSVLERAELIKVMHNASYDAVRLQRHLRINTSPIHDTMLAARRGGERSYSLQALALKYLSVRLDKFEQRGDWGARPLSTEQLQYSAMDAVTTLLIYERQSRQGLKGFYKLRPPDKSQQGSLPIESIIESPADAPMVVARHPPTPPESEVPVNPSLLQPASQKEDDAACREESISGMALALMGVVTLLPGRYSPDRLAVSVGASARVGLAGWTIDQIIGEDTDIDEETARLIISELFTAGLICINEDRRLEPTPKGQEMWEKYKS